MNIQIYNFNLFDLIAVLVFLIVPLGVSAVFYAQMFLVTDFRSPRQPVLNFIFLAGIIILPLFVYIGSKVSAAIPSSIYFACLTTLFAGVVGLTVVFLNGRRKLSADDILLDLGRIEPKMQAALGLMLIFFTFYISDIIRYRNVFMLSKWVTVFCSLNICIFLILTSFSKVYITKQGLTRLSGTLHWEQMTNYEWGEELGGKIKLMIRGKHKLSFFVFLEQQPLIEELFQKNFHLNQVIDLPQVQENFQ